MMGYSKLRGMATLCGQQSTMPREYVREMCGDLCSHWRPILHSFKVQRGQISVKYSTI